jgi:hypothetical protein
MDPTYRGIPATRDAVLVWEIVDAHEAGEHLASARHRPADGCTRRCITQRLGRRTAEQRDAAIAEARGRDWIELTGRFVCRTGASMPWRGFNRPWAPPAERPSLPQPLARQ